MLTFTTDVKFPKILNQSPLLEQNNKKQKSGVKQEESEIKGTVNGHRGPTIIGS